MVDRRELITDRSFLVELSDELHALIKRALNVSERYGGSVWLQVAPRRVYYVGVEDLPSDAHEPDEFSDGIGGATKLFYATVTQLATVDLPAALLYVDALREGGDPLSLRLWSAFARDRKLVPSKHVAGFLSNVDDDLFWDLTAYPEVAELRARRFASLESSEQEAIGARIISLPPRRHWSRTVTKEHVQRYRVRRAVLELKRIVNAGAVLPKNVASWFKQNQGYVPEIDEVDRVDADMETMRVRTVTLAADDRFDQVDRAERLALLEPLLAVHEAVWIDDPARGAQDWVAAPGNAAKLIRDFESLSDYGAEYVHCWDAFGRFHRKDEGADNKESDAEARKVANRVLWLLDRLPEATLREAISGVTSWVSRWHADIVDSPLARSVWTKLWPIAADVTNRRLRESGAETSTNRPRDYEFDALNSPAGRMLDLFLVSFLPNLKANPAPFANDEELRRMRDALLASDEIAGITSRYRLIQLIEYFLLADPDWAEEVLLKPLLDDNEDATHLWKAISMRWRFKDVVRILGQRMLDRAHQLQRHGAFVPLHVAALQLADPMFGAEAAAVACY